MKVRSFSIKNSDGMFLDLSASPELFGFNPEGFGVTLNNELVKSGGSFLINETNIEPNDLELNLLLGTLSNNPYGVYTELIRILSKPPYTFIYTTSEGTWNRQCVLDRLSKTEINSFNVMIESIVFKCSSPWYKWSSDEYLPQPQQHGDGKIYGLVQDWAYADDGYRKAPINGYKIREYWLSDPYELYPSKNLLGDIYYDELVSSTETWFDGELLNLLPNETPPTPVDGSVYNTSKYNTGTYGGILRTLQAATNESKTYYVSFDVNGGSLTQDYTLSIDNIKYAVKAGVSTTIFAPIKDGGDFKVLIKPASTNSVGTEKIILSKLYLTYITTDYKAEDIVPGPVVYHSDRGVNHITDREGMFNTFYTNDGTDNTRPPYKVIPSVYSRHEPFIYNSKYTIDYYFTEWSVMVSEIDIVNMPVKSGSYFNYSTYITNSKSSDDSIHVLLELIKSDGSSIYSDKSKFSIKAGSSNLVDFTNILLPKDTDKLRLHVIKSTKNKARSMGCSISSERISTINSSKNLLYNELAERTALINPNDWEKSSDTGMMPYNKRNVYNYDYVYAASDRPVNTYTLDNKSMYMRSDVNSPCEIIIHGPAENPRWELIEDNIIKQSDGYLLDVPENYKLVVSSVPNEQKAILIDPMGNQVNVYQQQQLEYSNFITIPSGISALMIYGVKGLVEFRYREERDVV